MNAVIAGDVRESFERAYNGISADVYERILWAHEGRDRPFVIQQVCRELGRATLNQAREILSSCGSFDVARALKALHGHMGRLDWWTIFGEEWSRADDGPYAVMQFSRWLKSASPATLAVAMDEKERGALDKLPETFDIWRGCYTHNIVGVSWSLSREIAAKFTTLGRYHRPDRDPLLVHGTAKRERCILKLDRDEQEIVTSWNDVEVADHDRLIKIWIRGGT